MADQCDALARLSVIEAALIDALDDGDADRVPPLAAERDAVLRSVVPALGGDELAHLVARDAAFASDVAARRAAIAAELETLRMGRKAARAYGETAGC